ncbi:MAG TPA: OB-fold nucleic acid binding domain-containing protein, partial [Chitinophagaceae bacterium]|nr:OB-fold nucleic acid binding domain-containing protein [Chitinophagaceae bacterium]
YTNINELRAINLPEAALERLADADAFRSIGLDRRQALWEAATKDRPIALFNGQSSADAKNEQVVLPEMSIAEHVVHDYASTSLSLKAHPVSFVRPTLQQLHVLSAKDLMSAKDGQLVKVAGLVLVRQRPGTAGGICFITIEDETGCANLVVFQNLFEEYRKPILQSKLIMVEGKLQVEGEVIHVIVSACYDFSKLLRQLTSSHNENLPELTTDRPDEKLVPPGLNKKTQVKENAQEKVFPGGRNFR